MDGEISTREQVLMIRAAIGRKIMEIDEFDKKAAEATGQESEKFMNAMEMLNNDIIGYKMIIDEIKYGWSDVTGNLYNLNSLPEETVALYREFYCANLSEDDARDESLVSDLKCKYAVDLANNYLVHMGRMALVDQRVIDLIMADEELVAALATLIMDRPEIADALNGQQ